MECRRPLCYNNKAVSESDISKMNAVKPASPLRELALLFLKLGIVGFGGPAVHIALMEEEVVRKRAWMSQEHFIDLVGATNLIPGPNSTELTMHIGRERAGWKGLVVAGCCFIIPAVLITGAVAWLYQGYGHLPQVQPFLYGIKPAIIAVVSAVMIGLARKAVKSRWLALIGIAAAIAVLAGVNEIAVLFGGGALGMLNYLFSKQYRAHGWLPFFLLQAQPLSEWRLLATFLKVGSILYGSGYVLFAFLDAELVAKGLLSKTQLADAIAVGQFTPGPVFSSATFIGWQLGGAPAAIAATIGIFLPAFLFVALLNPLLPRLRRSPLMSAFLDTVNVVSIAVILSVMVAIGKEALLDWRTLLIAIAGLVVTIRFPRINTAFVILGGAAVGYLLTLV
jgi:chromate transporter